MSGFGVRASPAIQRPLERRSAKTFILSIHPPAALEQKLNRIDVPSQGSPVQARLAIVFEPRVDLHASAQQEFDCAGSSEFTGPGESVLHLLRCCSRLQGTVVGKKAFDYVEPPDAGRAFQVELCSVVGKELCGCPAAIVQAAIDC